jgi:pimeloyl-ACP methyl ester carboxylesterase
MPFVRVSAAPEREVVLDLADRRSIAIAEWGPADGRPVFLFHGGPGSRLLCPDVEATHAAGVRLLAVDRSGYGGSSPRPGLTLLSWADDVGEVMDGLGIDRASIVGWSNGGAYAMGCAVGLGDRIRSIALSGSDAPLDEEPQALAAFSPRGVELVQAFRADPVAARPDVMERYAWYAADPTAIVRGALEAAPRDASGALLPEAGPDLRLFADAATAAAYEIHWHEGARQGTVGLADDVIAHYGPWGFSPADIRCPTTIWWGEQDHITARFHSDYLARTIPGARFHVVPDAGHSLPVTHWRDVLEELKEST